MKRLEKEVKRAEAGTAAVGGITKAGNAREELLREAAILVCAANGTPMRDQLRERRIRNPGATTYLRLLADNSARKVEDPQIAAFLATLARDATSRRRSKLAAMCDLRNANAHPGEVSMGRAESVMRSLHAFLARAIGDQNQFG